MRMNRAVTLCVAAGLGLWTLGCGGPSGPHVERGSVSGTVTVDGKPVPHGTISFVPDKSAGAKGPMAGATIVDGKYATPSGKGPVVGANIVRISAFDQDPSKAVNPEGIKLLGKTEEKATIKPGSQTLDFKLKGE